LRKSIANGCRWVDIEWKKRAQREAAGANNVGKTGLDDKAIESKIGELVREGAQ
jgi:hypothetical protein